MLITITHYFTPLQIANKLISRLSISYTGNVCAGMMATGMSASTCRGIARNFRKGFPLMVDAGISGGVIPDTDKSYTCTL